MLEALATLAFHYPRRADFFRTELEQFLLLARENGMDPLNMRGSFAGAIGIPQFMPGSQRRYAVDFDGDQKIDLSGSIDDAIGSVARFLEQHGWQAGQPIAVPARTRGEPERSLIEAGIQPTLLVADLAQQGISRRCRPAGHGDAGRSRLARPADRILARLQQFLRDHPLQPLQLLRHVGVPAGRGNPRAHAAPAGIIGPRRGYSNESRVTPPRLMIVRRRSSASTWICRTRSRVRPQFRRQLFQRHDIGAVQAIAPFDHLALAFRELRQPVVEQGAHLAELQQRLRIDRRFVGDRVADRYGWDRSPAAHRARRCVR